MTVSIAVDRMGPEPEAVATADQHAVESLLQRACAADPDPLAWNELRLRFGRLLLHTARRVGLNDSDAADVEQQTWILLWQHGRQIREPDRLASWLVATARRESLRVAMRMNRYRLSADPTSETTSAAVRFTEDTYPVDGDFEPPLEQALTRLPDVHQALLRLLMSDSCPSYAEAANQLDLPVGSIGPIRMRALHMLRRSPELAEFGRAVSTRQPQPL